MPEAPTPGGVDSQTTRRRWKDRALGYSAGVATAGIAAGAFALAHTDSGSLNAATCPRVPGTTIVTPDQVAGQQGEWLSYQGEICIDGITRVITGPREQIVEVVDPAHGTLQPATVYPETLFGKHNAVTVYTDSQLGSSARGDALIGDVYIGGPQSVTNPNLFVTGRIKPFQQS